MVLSMLCQADTNFGFCTEMEGNALAFPVPMLENPASYQIGFLTRIRRKDERTAVARDPAFYGFADDGSLEKGICIEFQAHLGSRQHRLFFIFPGHATLRC